MQGTLRCPVLNLYVRKVFKIHFHGFLLAFTGLCISMDFLQPLRQQQIASSTCIFCLYSIISFKSINSVASASEIINYMDFSECLGTYTTLTVLGTTEQEAPSCTVLNQLLLYKPVELKKKQQMF